MDEAYLSEDELIEKHGRPLFCFDKEMYMESLMQVIPTKCDDCGEIVEYFSDRSEWFGKYLKENEGRICFKCISSRDGYAQELLEKTGATLDMLSKVRR